MATDDQDFENQADINEEVDHGQPGSHGHQNAVMNISEMVSSASIDGNCYVCKSVADKIVRWRKIQGETPGGTSGW